ncbi:MAG: outer membrane beta-barrel protein [Alphaproteobacteria bacterium]|nr:outer membrane beta-barrel protein [Alphaproteobacteria bacterium]
MGPPRDGCFSGAHLMKTRTILLGAVAAVALTGTANAGQLPGWYVGIEGGANWVDDVDVQIVGPSGFSSTTRATASFDTGWAVLATVGYAFHNHFRLEGEVGYRHNKIDTVLARFSSTTGIAGDLDELSLMANVIYDIQLGSKTTLSLGVGAGADRAKLDTTANFFDDEDWGFAYQGIVGLAYNLSSKTQLTLNYRYFRVNDLSFDGALGLAAINTDDVTKHTVTLGLRYSFGHEEEPPPPPPPPPPPETNKHFIIFFGFNKCNITAEADSVLGEAAAAAKATGSASVTIVGHTDTVGSTRYNQKLSECRANATKSNLVGKGVPEGSISASGKGETELMVQTGDGVKEPQNRRATIDLN